MDIPEKSPAKKWGWKENENKGGRLIRRGKAKETSFWNKTEIICLPRAFIKRATIRKLNEFHPQRCNHEQNLRIPQDFGKTRRRKENEKRPIAHPEFLISLFSGALSSLSRNFARAGTKKEASRVTHDCMTRSRPCLRCEKFTTSFQYETRATYTLAHGFYQNSRETSVRFDETFDGIKWKKHQRGWIEEKSETGGRKIATLWTHVFLLRLLNQESLLRTERKKSL